MMGGEGKNISCPRAQGALAMPLRFVYFWLSVLVTLPKSFWPRVLGSVVIQLYTDECMPSVDRA